MISNSSDTTPTRISPRPSQCEGRVAQVALIVAVAENGVIGHRNGLPWRLPGDMAWFRQVTRGKPLVMGRRTWESLPKRPLPGRPNVVVTRNAAFDAPGGEVFSNLEGALERARILADELAVGEVVVIGGAEIYARTLPLADRIYLTEVHARPEGDTHFPEFRRGDWVEVSREAHAGEEGASADYSFVILERP